MADNVRKIKIEAVGLKDIKRELDDIKKSMKEATDPAEMSKLTDEADKLESTLGGVNDKVKEFGEESKDSLNGAGKSFDDLKTAITELDFTKVQSGVDSFAKASANMTFKGAITSLKSLGKTFLTLGKALLSNPLFIIAAVITAIVVAVYKFLDSLGLIEVAIDALMKPIQYIIDLFYSLTDAMGLTTVAAEKEANATAKAYEDSAKKIESANNAVIQSLNNQIRIAELNGESTVDLERQKITALQETAREIAKADKAAAKASMYNKELTEDEIRTIKEKAKASHLAYKQTIADAEFFEAKLLITREKAREDEATKIQGDADKARDERQARTQQRIADEKEYAANRLAAVRLGEDLDLELIEEGIDKVIALNKLKYARLIEDTIANEKLTEEEKLALRVQYEKLSNSTIEEIKKAAVDKEEATTLEAREKLNALLYDINTNEAQKALDDIEDYYSNSVEKLREGLEQGLITKQEFIDAEIQLELDKSEKLQDIEDATQDALKAKREAATQANIDLAENYASAVNGLAGTVFSISNSLGNQDEAAKEKRAKKQFKIQKALNLVMAGIDGARAITTSLASAPVAVGLVPNPAGIASLAAVALNTAATLAAIGSTTFEGGGQAPSPTTPTIGGSGSTPSRQSPVVNFQGTGSNSNEKSASGNNITIENTVKVSETEITDKQRTVANLSNQTQL